MTASGDPSIAPATRRSSLLTIALPVALVVLLVGGAWVVRASYLDAFEIPDAGMAPTLAPGDRIFVRKDAYGGREHRTPARGDIIVFRHPEHPDRDFVDRVIGVPGDTVAVQDGAVFINGWRIPTCVTGMAEVDIGEGPRNGFAVLELLGDTAYMVFRDPPGHSHDDEPGGHPPHGGTEGPYTVPYNEVFVLGDNREHSQDSRHWLEARGAGVRIDMIKGRASSIWKSKRKGRFVWGKPGSDLTVQPTCPEGFPPATCEAINRCLGGRPPREQTTPPPPNPPAISEPAKTGEPAK